MHETREAHRLQLSGSDAKMWSLQKASLYLFSQLRGKERVRFGVNIFVNIEFIWSADFVDERTKRKRGASDGRQWRRGGGFVTGEDSGDETAAIISQGSVPHRRG